MPEMTGMEFIAALNEKLPRVILTTSHTECAIEAFKFNVSGFLVKPVKYDQFCIAVKKVLNEQVQKKSLDFKDNFVFIKVGKTITKINKADIKLIECIGDYVTLFTENGKYTVHSSMKAMEGRFSEDEYLRVHRSFIIRQQLQAQ
ncbi:MAG: response regulator transcription factor [Bacteroidia bacterium]|nr:response regulator transcription factor [Bacteroidia bacterium]